MGDEAVDAPDVIPEENNFGRNTQHNSQSFWNSTGKKLFNAVMAPLGISFDDIELEDWVGDNSIVMFSEVVERCKRRPPVSAHTRSPFKADSLIKTLSTAIRLLKEKFRNQSQNLPPIFPEEMERSWRKRLKDVVTTVGISMTERNYKSGETKNPSTRTRI